MLCSQSNPKTLNVTSLYYTACYRPLHKELCMMDSSNIQWALQYAKNIQRQQPEELFSRVNSVLDAIPSQQHDQQQQQQNSYDALPVSSAKFTVATGQNDIEIVGYCHWNTGSPETVANMVNDEFNWQQQRQTEQNHNNKIVGDCFTNPLRTETAIATPTVNEFNWLQQQQQSGSNNKALTELAVGVGIGQNNINKNVGNCCSKTWCTETASDTVNELDWLQQQQTAYETVSSVESAVVIGQNDNNEIFGDCCSNTGCTVIGQNDNNEIFGDCCSNTGCTETASMTNEASPLINYLYYLYERPLSPVTAINMESSALLKQPDYITSDASVQNQVVSQLSKICDSSVNTTQNKLNTTSGINNVSGTAVSNDYDLHCVTSTNATVNELDWLQQQQNCYETVSSVESAVVIGQNDNNEIFGDCSNTGCTVIGQNDNNEIFGHCFSNTGCTETSSMTSENLQTNCPTKDINRNGNQEVISDESLKELQLTRISQSNNYHDQNNYLYSKKITRSLTRSYFRCKNYVRYGCPGTAVAKYDDLENSTLLTKHNHKSHVKNVDNEKFNKSLDEALKENELETPLKLYLRTKRKLIDEIDTSNIPPPKSKESFVRRRKIKRVPKLPKTISDFIEIMSDSQYKHFTVNERKSKFYRGVWEDNGNANIMYISQDALESLNTMDNIVLLMDGTFKVLPRHFQRKFRQLYVISFIYKGRSYPLAYTLMQAKDFKSYDLIFGRLKLLFPSVTVSGCMSDYEEATRKALMKHFPTARISGCFFHYVQAIHKKFKKLGMLKDEKFQEALQEVSALALLPNNYISPGFDYINKKMEGLRSERWKNFSIYWKAQWPKAHISVYGLTDRTNNFSESLNHIINSLSGPRPSIWQLISTLKLIDMQKADELKNNIGGLMINTGKTTEMKRLDAKIKEATNIFNENRDIPTFLKNVTFKDEFESFFKVRIFIVGVDEDTDDDDDENESDEIIPNWFNEQLNLGNAKRKVEVKEVDNKKRRVALLI